MSGLANVTSFVGSLVYDNHGTSAWQAKYTVLPYRCSALELVPILGGEERTYDDLEGSFIVPLNCSSISTWYPVTSLLVSLAIPMTACSS
jgi:hypothetical protein